MRQLFKLFMVAGVLVSLTGCIVAVDGDSDGWDVSTDGGSFEHQRESNRKEIAQLEPGLSYEKVKSELGTPDFTEFYAEDNQRINILFYYTHRVEADGRIKKNECTAVVFKNNELVGWGDFAYKKHKH